MQHVVDAIEVFGFFDGGDIGGFFDNAYQALVAGCAGAVDARVNIGDVVADRAQPQASFDVADSSGQRFRVFVARTQNVEGQPLRALRAHARQLLQFVDQPRHRLSKFRHRS